MTSDLRFIFMCQFYFESLINEKNQEYGKICLGNVENITYAT